MPRFSNLYRRLTTILFMVACLGKLCACVGTNLGASSAFSQIDCQTAPIAGLDFQRCFGSDNLPILANGTAGSNSNSGRGRGYRAYADYGSSLVFVELGQRVNFWGTFRAPDDLKAGTRICQSWQGNSFELTGCPDGLVITGSSKKMMTMTVGNDEVVVQSFTLDQRTSPRFKVGFMAWIHGPMIREGAIPAGRYAESRVILGFRDGSEPFTDDEIAFLVRTIRFGG